MKKALLVALLTLATASSAAAEDRLSLSIVQSNANLPLLSGFRFSPVHPGAEAGFERTWTRWGALDLYQDVSLLYVHHAESLQSLSLKTDVGLRWHAFGRFFADAHLGLGYTELLRTGAYSISPSREIVRDGVALLPAVSPTLGLSVGADLGSDLQLRIGWESTLHYYGLQELDSMLPFMPYGLVKLGLRYSL